MEYCNIRGTSTQLVAPSYMILSLESLDRPVNAPSSMPPFVRHTLKCGWDGTGGVLSQKSRGEEEGGERRRCIFIANSRAVCMPGRNLGLPLLPLLSHFREVFHAPPSLPQYLGTSTGTSPQHAPELLTQLVRCGVYTQMAVVVDISL